MGWIFFLFFCTSTNFEQPNSKRRDNPMILDCPIWTANINFVVCAPVNMFIFYFSDPLNENSESAAVLSGNPPPIWLRPNCLWMN